jgi:hypothetical protein
MRRRLLPLLLCLSLLGCHGTRIRVFGWEPKQRVQATEMTGEEKAGVVLLLAVAIGGAVYVATR